MVATDVVKELSIEMVDVVGEADELSTEIAHFGWVANLLKYTKASIGIMLPEAGNLLVDCCRAVSREL